MTGPEHYRQAERLLAEAADYDAADDQTTVDILKLTAAQVHATLALAAATAQQHADSYIGDNEQATWAAHRAWSADLENLVSIEGPGCFVCEQTWTPEVAAAPCPGDPS